MIHTSSISTFLTTFLFALVRQSRSFLSTAASWISVIKSSCLRSHWHFVKEDISPHSFEYYSVITSSWRAKCTFDVQVHIISCSLCIHVHMNSFICVYAAYLQPVSRKKRHMFFQLLTFWKYTFLKSRKADINQTGQTVWRRFALKTYYKGNQTVCVSGRAFNVSLYSAHTKHVFEVFCRTTSTFFPSGWAHRPYSWGKSCVLLGTLLTNKVSRFQFVWKKEKTSEKAGGV